MQKPEWTWSNGCTTLVSQTVTFLREDGTELGSTPAGVTVNADYTTTFEASLEDMAITEDFTVKYTEQRNNAAGTSLVSAEHSILIKYRDNCGDAAYSGI